MANQPNPYELYPQLTAQEVEWCDEQPGIIEHYMQLATRNLLLGRPVRFADFAGTAVESLFVNAGLIHILDTHTAERRGYKRMVRLFDAHLQIDVDDNGLITYGSWVKGTHIFMNEVQFGEILNIRGTGLDINDLRWMI